MTKIAAIKLALVGVGLAFTLSAKSASGPLCIDQQNLATPESEHIIQSLKNIYHGGHQSKKVKRNILCMTGEQVQRAKKRLGSLTRSIRRNYIEKRFKDESLQLMALRDSDNDGILDFRIKEQGAFIQNDPDADNDGIVNLFDSNPIVANSLGDSVRRNDTNKNGLPNHLDWANNNRKIGQTRKSPKLIEKQLAIFQQYGIVLMDSRGVSFTEPLAEAVEDVLNVFSFIYHRDQLANGIKSITYAEKYGVDDYGVIAEVSPVNGQLIIYQRNIGQFNQDPKSRVPLFLTLVHEFTHVMQNAMDFPQNQTDLLKFNTHSNPINFIRLMNNKFGWNISTNVKQRFNRRGFVDHGVEPLLAVETYRSLGLKQLGALCKNKDEPTKRQNLKNYDAVSCYSLNNSREWHAEVILASVLSKMANRLKATRSENEARRLLRLAQLKIREEWNNEIMSYWNLPKQVLKHIYKDIKLSNALLDKLNQRYIISPFSDGSADVD